MLPTNRMMYDVKSVIFWIISNKCFFRCLLLMWSLLCCQGDDVNATSLFTGEEELFAFERVVSRMTEMCTAAYWAHAEELRKR